MKKLTCIIFVTFSLLAPIQGIAQDEDGLPLPFLEQWNLGTVKEWGFQLVIFCPDCIW